MEASLGTGLLPCGDGQRIFWEATGSPVGRPVLLLHGGPGSGSSPSTLRFFPPERFLRIRFDQRGCGQSLPHAGDPGTSLVANTTAHLLSDIETLRRFLGLDAWLLYGSSWGSTLAIAYAQAHPERVEGVLLAGVTMTRPAEIDWLYRGLGLLFPAEWERFRDPLSDRATAEDIVAAYRDRLEHPDPSVHQAAADAWHDWEALSVSAGPDASPPPRWSDPRYRLARARICAHFFHHRAWLAAGQLLLGAPRLHGIPAILVQGRLDLAAPMRTAWELSRAWPGSELVVVPGAGHASSDPGMEAAIHAAVARLFARATPSP